MHEIFNNRFSIEEKYLNYGFYTALGMLFSAFILIPLFAGQAILKYSQTLSEPYSILIICLPPQLAMLAAMLLIMRFTGEGSINDKLWLKNWNNQYFKVCFATVLVLVIVCVLVTVSFKALLQSFDIKFSEPAIIRLALSCDLSSFIVIAFSAVVVAPVVEEILFRRVIFGFIAARSGIIPALVLTSCMFAMIHDSGYQMPALFLLGAAFQLMFLRYHSLFPAMLLHCFNNLVAIIGIMILRILGFTDL
jgi:membrane protease YdiL (CAAX protease family)